ncbi:MAG: hypothetical protein ACT4P0_04200 [Panacagrimonas sp.]
MGGGAFGDFQKTAVWLMLCALASLLAVTVAASPLSLYTFQPRFAATSAAATEHWTAVDSANGKMQVKTAPVILHANSIPRIGDASRPLPGTAPCPEPPEQRTGSAFRIPAPCLPARLTAP